MDFSFNFGQEEDEQENKRMDEESMLEKPKQIPFKKVEKIKTKKFIQVGGVSFLQILLNSNELDEGTLNLLNKTNNTDLIPHVYEGGFKIWECSVDMMEYLEEVNFDFKNKSVIDLGW
jgi:hypothetical protein